MSEPQRTHFADDATLARIQRLENAIDQELVAAGLGTFGPNDDPQEAINKLCTFWQGVGQHYNAEKSKLEVQCDELAEAVRLYEEVEFIEVLGPSLAAREAGSKALANLEESDGKTT